MTQLSNIKKLVLVQTIIDDTKNNKIQWELTRTGLVEGITGEYRDGSGKKFVFMVAALPEHTNVYSLEEVIDSKTIGKIYITDEVCIQPTKEDLLSGVLELIGALITLRATIVETDDLIRVPFVSSRPQHRTPPQKPVIC